MHNKWETYRQINQLVYHGREVLLALVSCFKSINSFVFLSVKNKILVKWEIVDIWKYSLPYQKKMTKFSGYHNWKYFPRYLITSVLPHRYKNILVTRSINTKRNIAWILPTLNSKILRKKKSVCKCMRILSVEKSLQQIKASYASFITAWYLKKKLFVYFLIKTHIHTLSK